MATCKSCGTKKPMIESSPWVHDGESLLCPKCARQRSNEIAQSITVITGGLREAYQTLDSVFAIEGTTAGVFQGINPGAAFEGVKQQLRTQCDKLGGNAVIHCQFQYRNAVSGGLFGKNQSLEIFAYGTAVRVGQEPSRA